MIHTITHSKWTSSGHFEALGCEDACPNMVIRFDYSSQSGWRKWRHGGWLPIALPDVPADVMARYDSSMPESEREGHTSLPIGPLERPVTKELASTAPTTNTREERRKELKRLAAMPNGLEKLYSILTRNFIPFEKLPIATLMIEAILNHEFLPLRTEMDQ